MDSSFLTNKVENTDKSHWIKVRVNTDPTVCTNKMYVDYFLAELDIPIESIDELDSARVVLQINGYDYQDILSFVYYNQVLPKRDNILVAKNSIYFPIDNSVSLDPEYSRLDLRFCGMESVKNITVRTFFRTDETKQEFVHDFRFTNKIIPGKQIIEQTFKQEYPFVCTVSRYRNSFTGFHIHFTTKKPFKVLHKLLDTITITVQGVDIIILPVEELVNKNRVSSTSQETVISVNLNKDTWMPIFFLDERAEPRVTVTLKDPHMWENIKDDLMDITGNIEYSNSKPSFNN